MATERLLMRHIREILRLKWTLRRSHRETARSLGISAGAVASVVTRAKAMALTWDVVGALSDDVLERTLYGPKLALSVARPGPDLVWMHTELRRPGVTLELLHLEYLAAHPDGYRYSAFCGHYRRWLARQRTSMRQVHTAGEKMFVDYAGHRPSVVDPATGAIVPVELFVAVLGASNYTYAEATLTQRSVDFIQSHTRTVEYLGGVSAVVVPDQLRTGVTDPCRYEPTIQRTYADWARHYGTAIVPARPAKPRDKAKAEVAVQVAERWILARLRNETFFTLAALNARIADLLTDLNDRPMKGYGGASRRGGGGGGGWAGPAAPPPAGWLPPPQRSLRPRRLAARARQHRLSRRGRPALLLRPARVDSRRRRDLPDGDDGRCAPARRARLAPRA